MNELLFDVLQVVIISAIVAVLRYMIPYLTGLLRSQNYNFATDIVETLVRSAEQTFLGYKRGTEKFDHVIASAKAQFEQYGIEISDAQLIQLLEAAVQAMNAEIGVVYVPEGEIEDGECDQGDNADDSI